MLETAVIKAYNGDGATKYNKIMWNRFMQMFSFKWGVVSLQSYLTFPFYCIFCT